MQGGAGAEVLMEESKCTVGFLGDVGIVRGPLQDRRQENAKIVFCEDLLENSIAVGMEGGLGLDTVNVTLPGIEMHPPGVSPCLKPLEVLL